VKWERLADLSYQVVDDHAWACGWVPCGAMDRHIDHACALRVEPCPSGCGQTLFVGKMAVHLLACPRKVTPCPLECGREMEARLLEGHVAVGARAKKERCSVILDFGFSPLSPVRVCFPSSTSLSLSLSLFFPLSPFLFLFLSLFTIAIVVASAGRVRLPRHRVPQVRQPRRH